MRGRALALVAWAIGVTSPAFSQPTAAEPPSETGNLARKRECISAHAAVQRSRAALQLSAARKHALSCGQVDCPAVLTGECEAWLREIAAEQPTVVFVARDASGRSLQAVTVREGSIVLTRRMGGRGVDLDPGLHTLSFEGEGTTRVQQVLVHSVEKSQLIEVVFPERRPLEPTPRAHSAAPSAPPGAGLPTASWILGGVAAAGLLSAGYFGISGLSQQRDLERTCAPRCPSSDVDSMQRSYLVADISLGVALAAAAGAVWVALSQAPRERGAAARARPVKSAGNRPTDGRASPAR